MWKERIQLLFGDVGNFVTFAKYFILFWVGIGAFGGSATVKYFDSNGTGIFVLRVSRDDVINCSLALSCIFDIQKSPITIRVLKVAGSMRTCLMAFRVLLDKWKRCENDDSQDNWVENECQKLNLYFWLI